ncbi:carbon-nitrogen hydrolase family protein [Candidatus Neomarinimicrobiota bacterium]
MPIGVALVQARPEHLDLPATMGKTLALATAAAKGGARIIVFGETWLTGYPAWIDSCPSAALWGNEPTKQAFAKLRMNSITVPGPEIDTLANLAGKLEVVIVMGAHERVAAGPGAGTLYNALLTFGPDGKLLNHHRKLVPTYTEKLVWGSGDGAGLNVCDTPYGRISGSICWEHWMPLARQTLHEQGEDIHIAAWPTVHDMHQLASRHYAFEGRCYVLASGTLMKVRDLPEGLDPTPDLVGKPDELLVRGGSCIIGPDGKFIVEPVFDVETIVTATLEPLPLEAERMTLDVAGHYARPDVFSFGVNKERP